MACRRCPHEGRGSPAQGGRKRRLEPPRRKKGRPLAAGGLHTLPVQGATGPPVSPRSGRGRAAAPAPGPFERAVHAQDHAAPGRIVAQQLAAVPARRDDLLARGAAHRRDRLKRPLPVGDGAPERHLLRARAVQRVYVDARIDAPAAAAHRRADGMEPLRRVVVAADHLPRRLEQRMVAAGEFRKGHMPSALLFCRPARGTPQA